MDKLIIEGPATLKGSVHISRAKNAYLPILAGVLLSEKPVHLRNLPKLRDINTMIRLLEKLGVKVTRGEKLMTFDSSNITSLEATYELVKTMRASILVLGPLLARFKRAKVSLPGGCAIGARPIDIHLSNFEKMDAKILLEGGYVEATTNQLKGKSFALKFPSVGATENLMMGAVLAEGKTVIKNAALEPEIDDLAHFLVAMGAKIEGIGTSEITIHGVKQSEFREFEYEAIGDRIEASTYLIAAIATNSEITITGSDPVHLDSVIETLREMGAQIETAPDTIKVKKGTLKACKIDTAPYPGFPTDVQAQMIALVTQAEGASIITEHIFENRFMHVPELLRLGAKIELKGNSAIVTGKSDLKGAPVMCTDLRASAALIIAALAAKGKTEILRVYHLDRGYEVLDQKLRNLGVKIERVNEDD